MPSPPLSRLGPLATVIAGGLVGSFARHLLGASLLDASAGFPLGLVVVNLSGSLALGWLLARRQAAVMAIWSLRFWAVGMLGSFTTFSGFTLDVFALIEAGAMETATSYLLVSVVGGLVAAYGGLRIGSLR